MTGELAAARATIAGALVAGGVPSPDPGEPWDPPCAIVRPGVPWLRPARVGPIGARAIRINVLLIAGAADTTASLLALEGLAEPAVLALAGLAGWSTPDVSAARAAEVFGGIYLVAELELEGLIVIEAPPAPPPL